MISAGTVLRRVPAPLRGLLFRHRELLKFGVVGGICFVVTIVLNYALKLTVLNDKPLTAQGIAILVATIVSYLLSREWSFRTRGGRERRYEAALFFLISGIAVGINVLPLAVSRYLLHLQVPQVTLLTQEVADFGSGIIVGTLLAMVFRWWAFKKWVFPEENARPRNLTSTSGVTQPIERGNRAA
ncbi:putative flippase GtrA [Tamaricihabitans halophyticus]|uniref:Putative flippase GtrA n=1 Tax=Tamaricihabitans halophyticus TaxID=1262583 RepID=A0A4R2R0F6_9PSEU|nr:GtrA family protein [Tamaricihabitans halophyticus]TCP56102.1 putative flippase GtrA [Tamaricihabitans halophyticus]